LTQKDQPQFNVAKSTLLLYGPEVTGWDPVPIALARLGLSSELAKDLERFPQRWQIYVNGWGHWGLEGEVNKDYEYYFRTNQVRDVSPGVKSDEKFPLPMWPFRHMSMEAMSVLATAMNEALLQSQDGIIRIVPAVTAQQSARFTLHARGGFIVSAEKKKDELAFVAIKSVLGNTCRIAMPWPVADLYVDAKKVKSVTADKIQEIKTRAGQLLILVPSGVRISGWTVLSETPAANQKARHHSSGKAQLGLERMF
jgi:alpha-L-fucosidase 2